MGFNSKYTGAEVEKLLDSIKNNALVESISWENIKDRPNSIEGYGIIDVYNKTEINNSLLKYVTLSTDQNITGIKSFINGFKLGDALITYNKDKKAFVFPGNLLVEGGVAWNSSIEGFEPETITDAVMIDDSTLGINENGEIYVKGGAGGGGSIKYPLSWSGYSSGMYDGSAPANISIPSLLSQLGNDVEFITTASVNSLLTDYLPKSGGVVSGDITVTAGKISAPQFLASSAIYVNGGVRDCINITTSAAYPAIVMKGANHSGEVRLYNRGGIDWVLTDEGWNNVYPILHSGNFSAYGGVWLANAEFDANAIHHGFRAGKAYNAKGLIDAYRGFLEYGFDRYAAQFNSNSENDLFYRWCENGTWLDWRKVAFTDSKVASATNADSATVLGYNSPFVQDFDALNYSNNGLYHFDGDYANLTGRPPHYSWNYSVLNMGSGSGRRQQVAIPHSTSRMFLRVNTDNNWSDWREFAFLDSTMCPTGDIAIQFPDGEYIDRWGNIRLSSTSGSWNVMQNDKVLLRILSDATLDLNPVGSIHRFRLIANNSYSYLQAGSSSGEQRGAICLSGYYSSLLTSLRLNTEEVVITGNLTGEEVGRMRIVTDSTYSYIQAASTSAGHQGAICLSGYFATQLTSLKLHAKETTITGNLLIAGEVTQNSSLVLKDIQGTRYLSIEELEQLKPYNFYWKDGRDDKLHVGAIADHVLPILPEVISTDKKNIHSMNYANAAWIVCTSHTPYISKHEKEIVELKETVEKQKEEIKMLKDKLNLL